jgi:hypothetical protein
MERTRGAVGARLGYQPLLTEMLSLYPTFMEAGGTGWREGWQSVGHLAHGWFLRCHRGVEALLLLDANGFAEEASPLRRSIIEHVVALRWLAVEGDGILDTVARGHAHGGQRQRDAVATAGWASVDIEEVDRAVASAQADERDPANDNLLQFAQRAKKYTDAHTIVVYLSECARTHPSHESAVCYMDSPEEELRPNSRDDVWQVPFATAHLLEALGAVREAFDPRPWHDAFPTILRRFRTTTDEVRAEDGLPPVDWDQGKIATEADDQVGGG